MKEKSTKEKVATYLTQIKELSEEPGPPVKKATRPEVQEKEKSAVKKSFPQRQTKAVPVPDKVLKESEPDEIEDANLKDRKGVRKLPIPTKDIILGIVNVLTLVILFFILARLPKMANELKRLKDENAKTSDNISLQVADIEANREKAEKLGAAFLDDSGVVDFVKEIESLKTGGTVTKLSFASQKAVKDKTGNFGIPTTIDLTGNWDQILADLAKIEKIPFLFRAVSIEAGPKSKKEEEKTTNEIEFKYGGFLYVEDKLGEN